MKKLLRIIKKEDKTRDLIEGKILEEFMVMVLFGGNQSLI